MRTTRSVAKIQPGAVMASVLMSNDILPLVLDFVPRNEMRKVAMVCRFFMTHVASHLEPVILTFIYHVVTVMILVSRLTVPIRSQRRGAMSQVRAFQDAAEWTELNGFYYAIRRDTVVRYDPVDDVWTQLPSALCSTRQECGLVALENKLYLMGGKNVPQNMILSYFHVEFETWELVSSALRTRLMCCASLLDGFIYVEGGATDYDSAIARDERWHPGSNTRSWEQVASLNQARRSCNICTIEDRLYVFGGISESNICHEKLRDVLSSHKRMDYDCCHVNSSMCVSRLSLLAACSIFWGVVNSQRWTVANM